MAEKKKFLLRINAGLYAALEKWAADDLRSVNAQVEYLLTETAKKAGRLKSAGTQNEDPEAGSDSEKKGE